ncbi:MAG: GNAT family N-acetyltransferase, partial [Bacteroidota bacterium]
MLYARSWYLDVICPEWGAVVEGDYTRIMPVIFRKKWGMAYLFQSYHAQQLGVFSAAPVTPPQVEAFLQAIPRQFRWVDMKLNHGNTIAENGFRVVSHKNFELALNAPYAQLAAAYATNVRRNLRKAQAMDLVVACGENDHGDMVALFRANKGQQLHMLDERYYATLDRILTAARQRDLLEVWSVRHPQKGLLGGGIFLRGDGRLIFLLNITTAEGKAS